MAYCPFFSGHQLPRTWRSSAISPSSCGPSLVILGCFPPQLGPWAYYSKWARGPRSFGLTIAPQNPIVRNLRWGAAFWHSQPITRSIELYFLTGARASPVIHCTFLAFRRTRRIAINVSSSVVTRIALEYGKRIQWCLYETTQIWRLKAPLGIGWNSFRLTFFPWALWIVRFPRFRLLYKVPWEEHFPHPLALELFWSSKFPLFLDKKDAA